MKYDNTTELTYPAPASGGKLYYCKTYTATFDVKNTASMDLNTGINYVAIACDENKQPLRINNNGKIVKFPQTPLNLIHQHPKLR